MFHHTHYVPILKGKQGELSALAELSERAKLGLTPLIEAPFLEATDESDEPTIALPLVKLPVNLERSWGGDRRFFLDLGLVASDPSLANGIHPVEFVFAQTRERGLLAVPVTDLRQDEQHHAAVAGVVAVDERGICARLDSEDFDDIDASVEALEQLLQSFRLARTDVDLVLDLGQIDERQVGSLGLVAHGLIESLRGVGQWRTLTLAATSFPSVRDFGPDTITPSPRAEWLLWNRLRRRGGVRMPTFSDYGIVGIQTAEPATAQVFAPSPNLRYTTDDEYVVLKARHPRHGYEQFNGLCAALVRRNDYAGADFSWGDAYISRCAQGNDGPGNATKWIQAGTNHHLEGVVAQLANLGA